MPAEHVAAIYERAAAFAGCQHVHQPLARRLRASISSRQLWCDLSGAGSRARSD